ncbi:MAG: hypothetical protein LAT68_11725 [Cyclobacteriaceae bacterium]|nr:hypothetical protein [Cyclobacteriaceae bacterium]MCH8516985.1 hypothetical protein [Cyclobacteriaceae bacterium]
MKLLKILALIILLASPVLVYGQQGAMTIQEARIAGVEMTYLDSIFISAIHTDTSQALFKTAKEWDMVAKSYRKLLRDLSKHLNKNKYYWEQPTRMYSRAYFNSDGTIAYFLYNFIGKTAEEKPSYEQQEAFKKLANDFIVDYKFKMKADMKFAQCITTTFMP